MNKVEYLESKVRIPAAGSETVFRTGLYEKLDSALSHKLAVVSAPAGFGKTTALSTWVASRKKTGLHGAWFSVDENDDNAFRFWSYFMLAIDSAEPGVTHSALKMLAYSDDQSMDIILSVLLNALSSMGKSMVIILDDFHLIKQDKIHDGIKYFVRHAPQNIHLILSGRGKPRFNLSKLRMRNDLSELSQEDFVFSDAEASEYLNHLLDTDVSQESAALLNTYTEGWAVGLQAAALSIGKHEDKDGYIRSIAFCNKYMLDFFAEEVLNDQTPDVRAFLMCTSILEHLIVPLCDATVGINTSAEILYGFEKSNLFIISLDENRQAYRYHHLFADFLRNQLRRYNPEMIPVLYNRAARWYEDNDFITEAAIYCLKGGNTEQAIALIEKESVRLLAAGELRKLLDVMTLLPDDIILSRPRLSANLAWIKLLKSDYEGAKEYIGYAEANIISYAGADREALQGEIAVYGAMADSFGNNPDRALQKLEQAQKYAADNGFLKSYIALNLGLAYAFKADRDKAVKYFAECFELSKKAHNIFTMMIAYDSIGGYLLQQGKCAEAEIFFENTLQYLTKNGVERLPISGMVYINAAKLYYLRNQLDKAEVCALKSTRRVSGGPVTFEGYMLLAKIYLAKGRASKSDECIREADRIARNDANSGYRKALELVKLELELYGSKVEAAEMRIKLLGLHVEAEAIPKVSDRRILPYMLFARYLFKKSRYSEACSILDKLLEQSASSGRLVRETEIRVLKSVLYDIQGKTTKALSELSTAVQLAHGEKYARCFLNEGESVRKLLLRLISPVQELDDAGKAFVAELLDGFQYGPANKAGKELLSGREMEVLKMVEAGATNKEIAEKLIVAVSTVKTHLLNIYEKFDANSRTKAVMRARELNIL